MDNSHVPCIAVRPDCHATKVRPSGLFPSFLLRPSGSLVAGISARTRNVRQCPTWSPPCRIQVAPSVQRRKVWLTPNTGVPCSNASKTRNPLKFTGVSQTNETISAASGPKFTILWGHVDEVGLLLLNKFFFPIVDTCLSCEDKVVRWCPECRFFQSCIFSKPRATHFRPAF